MSLRSWGNYPKIENRFFSFKNLDRLKNYLQETKKTIPYGNGRSYGDSALYSEVITVRPRNYFLDFDPKEGILHLQSGVLLSEILEIFVPKGWFLKITPGTKLVTVGGAIAADIHGKNHHKEGCFSECVDSFTLLLPCGEIRRCSKRENNELFRATCGGMGLTGVILDARIQLKRIRSRYIEQTTLKTRNLKETFDAFEEYADAPYSVAWIDCLAKGHKMGRSLLMVGDFAKDGTFDSPSKKRINIPVYFPGFALNTWSIRIFNALYYGRVREDVSRQKVDFEDFFYPLDSIYNWNRIYGRKGFTQYQFILPKEVSYQGLQEILGKISDAGKGSFLAVLKLYGPENENYLSFPMRGYSLALDFKIEKGLFKLLDSLDTIVDKYGGRIYLAKDVRVSKEVFENGYPHIEKFRKLRKQYKMDLKFQSLQSERLHL